MSADIASLEAALKEKRLAKLFQKSCRDYVKSGGILPNDRKRAAAEAPFAPSSQKRLKPQTMGHSAGTKNSDLVLYESSLDLPISLEEEAMEKTKITVNRAPLVLAFAYVLLHFTMPEQPPSSRLSLAQAMVSANSKSKAVGIGVEKGPSVDESSWSDGQPRVHIMGREIAVLKRGGYLEILEGNDSNENHEEASQDSFEIKNDEIKPEVVMTSQIAPLDSSLPARQQPYWTTSRNITFKSSTFIARCIPLSAASSTFSASSVLTSLHASIPSLRTATHNVWAYRTVSSSNPAQVLEASEDDGERGAGSFILSLMRQFSAIRCMVIVTRWFGGTMLGPDRWRMIRSCVAECLVESTKVAPSLAKTCGVALWGLDLETMRTKTQKKHVTYGKGRNALVDGLGDMTIHHPETARDYLVRSFTNSTTRPKGNNISDKTILAKAVAKKDATSLALLLGALHLLFASWSDVLSIDELDARAWSWYCAVRPDVAAGPSGWGARGDFFLSNILRLRRPALQPEDS